MKPFATPLQNFFVTTFLVTLFYFSVQKHKLEVHMLPAYPFLVYAGVMQLGQWRWPVRIHWRMVWLCRILLLVIFVGGLACPWININAGCYGRVCYRANRISREMNTEDFYVYKLRRTKGMDAYLRKDPIEVTSNDIAEGKISNSLLIMKDYRLDQLRSELNKLDVPKDQQGEKIDELGAYAILYFK